MESENNQPQPEDLPPPLIAELRRADRRVSLITSRVDRRISRLAQVQFSDLREPVWRSRPAWAAIAAMLLIGLFVVESRLPPPVDRNAIYADIDGSGRIDIADVLVLARSRDSGKISQAEIDAFAMRIVSLNPIGDAS